MPYHVVCRDCPVERMVASADRASVLAATHRFETLTEEGDAHTVAYDSVPGPAVVSGERTVEPTVK